MRSLILYLLFFYLPFQTRILVLEGANEYQSIFLYATDILIGVLFFLWLRNLTKSDFVRFVKLGTLAAPAFFLIGWFFLSSIFPQNPSLGFWRTLKIAEFLWLFFYLLLLTHAVYANVLKALVASGIFQSVIAIGQFITQHDLGLRILGENILAPDIAGIAKLEVFGEKFIRAYGTLPHPNVLAVFLLLCIFALLFLHLKEKKYPIPYTLFRAKRETRFCDSRFLYPIPFLTLALLLTFSRIVIIFGIVALAAWFFFNYKQKLLKPLLVTAGSLFVFSITLFPYFSDRLQVSLSDQAIAFRVWYTKNAFEAISQQPVLGVGPGQFTSFQEPLITANHFPPWANQPVHNMYLLLGSEAGLPALFFFFWLLISIFHPIIQKKQLSVVSGKLLVPIAFLAIGFFDHFFLTYQQGALIFWTSLAFCCKK